MFSALFWALLATAGLLGLAVAEPRAPRPTLFFLAAALWSAALFFGAIL